MRGYPRAFAGLLFALLLGLAGSHLSAGQAARGRNTAPTGKTEWGDPDFEGTYNYATMTPLERPRDLADRPPLSDAEAAAYEQRTIERQSTANNTAGPDWWDPGTRHLVNNRTSLIVDPVDGRVPPLTAAAQTLAAARAQGRRRNLYDGPEDLELKERCLAWEVAGPPMMPGVYNNDVQFMQTRDSFVIVNEMIHDVRIVPLDGRPHGTMPRWMGDSRGHWEGQTLVVETVHFSAKTSIRGSDTNLRLVERFTREGPDTVDYQVTLEDQTVWTRPWTAAFPMHRTSQPMYEYACHEGNFRRVEGMLRASRTQDK